MNYYNLITRSTKLKINKVRVSYKIDGDCLEGVKIVIENMNDLIRKDIVKINTTEVLEGMIKHCITSDTPMFSLEDKTFSCRELVDKTLDKFKRGELKYILRREKLEYYLWDIIKQYTTDAVEFIVETESGEHLDDVAKDHLETLKTSNDANTLKMIINEINDWNQTEGIDMADYFQNGDLFQCIEESLLQTQEFKGFGVFKFLDAYTYNIILNQVERLIELYNKYIDNGFGTYKTGKDEYSSFLDEMYKEEMYEK